MAFKKQRIVIVGCLLFITASVHAQSGFFPAFTDLGNTRGTGISGSIDWESGIVSVSLELNLVSAGIRLPAGRMRAEEILEDEYWRLLRPYLFSIQADSSSTVYDMIKNGDLSLAEFDRMEQEVRKIPPALTPGLTSMTARSTLLLGRISAFLLGYHATSRNASAFRTPFIPVPAANYTGIVIIADTMLPIHGRNTAALVKPCLFPKIWDNEMTLIYDRIRTGSLGVSETSALQSSVVYAPLESIMRATPSGLDPALQEIVGTNPLRIIACGVFGINPTDLVIDKADAMLISSSENNRRLLSENRIVVAVNNSVLSMPFEAGGY